jgi:hypothetical protein
LSGIPISPLLKFISIIKKVGNHLKWFIAIPFILFGAFLLALTIDQMGTFGHIMMKFIGVGMIFLAGLIVRS